MHEPESLRDGTLAYRTLIYVGGGLVLAAILSAGSSFILGREQAVEIDNLEDRIIRLETRAEVLEQRVNSVYYRQSGGYPNMPTRAAPD